VVGGFIKNWSDSKDGWTLDAHVKMVVMARFCRQKPLKTLICRISQEFLFNRTVHHEDLNGKMFHDVLH
jgi:hypothetical protein